MFLPHTDTHTSITARELGHSRIPPTLSPLSSAIHGTHASLHTRVLNCSAPPRPGGRPALDTLYAQLVDAARTRIITARMLCFSA